MSGGSARNRRADTGSNLSQLAEEVLIRIPAAAFLYALVVDPLMYFGIGAPSSALNTAASEGSFLNKIFWISLFITTFLSANCIRRYNWRFHIVLIPLSAYLILAVTSAIWSDHPEITIRRSGLQICLIGSMLLPFLFGVDTDRILLKVTDVCIVAVIFNCGALLWSGLEQAGARGIYAQKNVLGQAMSLSAALILWRIWAFDKMRTLFGTLLAAATLILLVLSKSKTSQALVIISFLPTFFCFTLRRLSPGLKDVSFLISLIAICAFGLSIVMGAVAPSAISEVIYGDPTFTGRSVIWEFADKYISQRPLMGHGYGAFWGVGRDSAANDSDVLFISDLVQAHNGFIDVHLELGLIGLTIAWCLVAVSFLSAIRLTLIQVSRGLLCMFLMFFGYLNNAMESSIFRSSTIVWLGLLLAFGILMVPLRGRRVLQLTHYSG